VSAEVPPPRNDTFFVAVARLIPLIIIAWIIDAAAHRIGRVPSAELASSSGESVWRVKRAPTLLAKFSYVTFVVRYLMLAIGEVAAFDALIGPSKGVNPQTFAARQAALCVAALLAAGIGLAFLIVHSRRPSGSEFSAARGPAHAAGPSHRQRTRGSCRDGRCPRVWRCRLTGSRARS
jgi:hypothetical protein